MFCLAFRFIAESGYKVTDIFCNYQIFLQKFDFLLQILVFFNVRAVRPRKRVQS